VPEPLRWGRRGCAAHRTVRHHVRRWPAYPRRLGQGTSIERSGHVRAARVVYTLSIYVFCGLLRTVPAGHAQEPAPLPPATQIREKQTTLLDILRSINQLEHELTVKQEELRSPRAEGRHEEVTQHIQEIGVKLARLRKNLNEIASGVDPEAFARQQEELGLDWQKRLLELLSPVLNELRIAHLLDRHRLDLQDDAPALLG